MSKCGSMRQTAMFAVAEMREMLSHYDGISDEVVDEIARSIVEGWFQASQAWVTAEALESKLIEATGKAQPPAVDEYAQLVMDYKRRHPEFQFTGDEYKTTNNTNKEDHAVEED